MIRTPGHRWQGPGTASKQSRPAKPRKPLGVPLTSPWSRPSNETQRLLTKQSRGLDDDPQHPTQTPTLPRGVFRTHSPLMWTRAEDGPPSRPDTEPEMVKAKGGKGPAPPQPHSSA